MLEKDSVARELARRHYDVEPGISQIFTIIDVSADEQASNVPIKLLEVNDATVPAGVMPLQFAPAPASGIPFPSVIVEVTPEEFQLILSKELPLPVGWKLGVEMPRGGC